MKSTVLLRSLLAIAVLVSGIAPVALAAGRGTPASAADTISRSVFADEFDGARGGPPDATKWVAGDSRAGLTGDGQLVLATQLHVLQPFTQANGRAEARIRMSRAGGAWRALGVLDESGNLPAGQVEVLGDDQVSGDDFHTYVIDWTPASLVWSMDGRKVLKFTPEVPGRPLVLTLNPGAGGRRSDSMVVDHVRVSVRVTVEATTWKTYTTYKPGKYVRFKGNIYRVRELHTSLPGWQPTLVPGLFQKI
ncbi:carbohydrate-binding protein [Actinoplanes sp. GCM10030250]|uniref:carbohydrate-binding protein n=1 Tax=Actinoplanes sp. GCM10030250 TaxID=3273376 RepID=UPI00360C8088